MPFLVFTLFCNQGCSTNETDTVAWKAILNAGDINNFIWNRIESKWYPFLWITSHEYSSLKTNKGFYIIRFYQTWNNSALFTLFRSHRGWDATQRQVFCHRFFSCRSQPCGDHKLRSGWLSYLYPHLHHLIYPGYAQTLCQGFQSYCTFWTSGDRLLSGYCAHLGFSTTTLWCMFKNTGYFRKQ